MRKSDRHGFPPAGKIAPSPLFSRVVEWASAYQPLSRAVNSFSSLQSPVRGPASRAQSNGVARGFTSCAESNGPVVNPNLHGWCFRLSRQAPSLMGRPPGVDRKLDAPDVEVQAYEWLSVSGLYCIELERRLRRVFYARRPWSEGSPRGPLHAAGYATEPSLSRPLDVGPECALVLGPF